MEFVIDLETLGTGPDAAILSIGVAAVVTETLRIVVSNQFNIDVEADDSRDRRIEPGTVRWWMGQSENARNQAFSGCWDMGEALDELESFIFRARSDYGSAEKDGMDYNVWGCGPSFDLTILRHAYEQLGRDVPWEFRRERCVRTICDLYGVRWKKYLPEGAAHCAMEDAIAEANGVIECLKMRRNMRSRYKDDAMRSMETPEFTARQKPAKEYLGCSVAAMSDDGLVGVLLDVAVKVANGFSAECVVEATHRILGDDWLPIETAPPYDGVTQVWIHGGSHAGVRAAHTNGLVWKRKSLIGQGPTHWKPLRTPEPPAQKAVG